MSDTIFVHQSSVDADRTDARTFVIDEEIRRIDEDEAYDVYGDLHALQAGDRFDVPVYEIVAHHVWRDGATIQGSKPYFMDLLVIVYERLRDLIETEGAERIVCTGLEPNYRRVVEDLAREKGIDVTVEGSNRDRISDLAFVAKALFAVAVLFADQLLSLVLKPLFVLYGTAAEVAVVFPAGRPKILSPVYDDLDVDVETVFSTKTASYLLKYRNLTPGTFRARPINTYVTVRTIAAELVFLGRFLVDLFVVRSLETELIDALEASEGVRMDRTAGRLFRRAALFNLDALLEYVHADAAFDGGRFERVLIPNNAGWGKAIAYAGVRRGVGVYRHPHSITYKHSKNEANYDHTLFLEGEIGAEWMNERKNVRPVVSGFAKHLEILERREAHDRSGKRPTDGRILLATQPFADQRRTELVRDVIVAVCERTEFDVLVKPHPGEDVEFYLDLFEEAPFVEFRDRIAVETGDFFEYVVGCDALVTINSNVALESVIAGTPAFCYNAWSPDIRTALYVSRGSIPQFTSPDGLREFLREPAFESLYRDQSTMLEGDYRVVGNSLEAIAETISAELRGSDRTGPDQGPGTEHDGRGTEDF